MTSDDDHDFDLFGDLDVDEQKQAAARQATMNQANEARLNHLIQQHKSPQDRSIASNRWIYKYIRHHTMMDANLPTLLPQLLSTEECCHIMDHIPSASSNDWTTARHSAFPTTDIPIGTCPPLQYLTSLLQQRLVDSVLAPAYGFAPGQLGFRDLFLVRYDSHAQQGLAPHTDGCLMSFTILVNTPDDFDGGGTQFFITPPRKTTESEDAVIVVRPTRQGDAVHHDACIKHQGLDITRGQRILLVGFVDTIDVIQKDQFAQQKQGQAPTSRRI
ncbi:hypothetical protein BCR42DRAFT_412265 [Absidia repens]|uniref:Fe2OG dioxygenase domain-containing protein n=1 Tax=Absidia repens TaxID=90262 RepID=A0A1X2IJD2_9FUNG|nr:hypothetical protein BCR42DRAFT_412265 [Absidia repens]